MNIAKYVLSYIDKEKIDELFNWAKGFPNPPLIDLEGHTLKKVIDLRGNNDIEQFNSSRSNIE